MLRKTMFALAAAVALGATALTPTAASAHGGGNWHGGWYGWHGPIVRVYAGPVDGGCVVRRWVYTPYGPVLRWVNRCY
ncbi:MAG TPA: sulfur globule protein precursor [Xanthobacteraceae bacterium]|nr:sulfur globule protein precursor [Xanthobacteraceae bacterium]